MRRKDREITDENKIIEIISKCHCCRLGFNDSSNVYIVPLSFGFEKTGDQYTFFFHSAAEGRKIELINNGNPVGFELDTNYMLKEADISCGFSARFQSIIGIGKVSFVTDDEDKKHALRKIMLHNTGKNDWEFVSSMLEQVTVFKLDVQELSCKQHE